jgi:hypothetical protein
MEFLGLCKPLAGGTHGSELRPEGREVGLT